MIKFSVAEIFGKGMVLQRDKPVVVFGNADSGDRINVSFFDSHGRLLDEIFTVSKKNNTWQAVLSGTKAAIENKLVIENETSQEKIVIEDVSVGEVWLAGGQSNMEFFNKYDQDWNRTEKLSKNPNVHFYNVPQRAFEGHVTHNGPGRDGYGKWIGDHQRGYENFSAIGYSFARRIQEKLGVPVGIIGCNWGGTTASAWVPKEVLEVSPLDKYLKEYEDALKLMDPSTLQRKSIKAWEFIDNPAGYKNFEPLLYGMSRKEQLEYMIKNADEEWTVPMGPFNENRPAGLYETMLKKVIPYSIGGVLWYQGESDSGDRAFYYDLLLKGLIDSWRKEWQDDFPFIVAQLAPFKEWLACTNDNYKIVREKQQEVADTVKDVYLTSIMDIGDYYDIHPKQKIEIGRRMALLALSHVYDKMPVENAENPRFYKADVNTNHITLSFKYASNLSDAGETTVAVCVDGKKVLPEEVTVKDNQVILGFSDEKLNGNSINVSMGWDDYATINIKNEQGLPIAPFSVAI